MAIPRIRDFRGLKTTSFDGRGNYTIGVREQVIFPEIDYDKVDQVRGLDVTITTTAKTDAEAFALLQAFGMPFARDGRGPGADAAAPDGSAPAADEQPVDRRDRLRRAARRQDEAPAPVSDEPPAGARGRHGRRARVCGARRRAHPARRRGPATEPDCREEA